MPEATEIQKLHDTVKKAVTILTKTIPSPAQAKKDLEDTQRLLKDYNDSVKEDKKRKAKESKEAKEREEKRNVKAFELFSFMKKGANDYFEKTKIERITWGGLAKNMASGVKEWFDRASKNNNMLGRTLRFGAALWEATSMHIIGSIKNAFSKITGQVRDVLGPIAEAFDVVKEFIGGIFGFFKTLIFGFFRRTPPYHRRTNRLLQQLVKLEKDAVTRNLLGKDPKKKKTDLSVLGMVLIGAAAILAAYIRKFILPFEAIIKGFKVGPIIEGIKGFFTKRLPSFARFFSKEGAMGRFFAGIAKIFRPMMEFVKKIPLVSRIIGGLKFGFTKLVWPLTIILGIIDFVKGFMATEGNIADKIIGGLKQVVNGLIEFPIKALGWVVEKIAGMFGIELEGTGEKMLSFVNKIMDWIFKIGPFGIISDVINAFKTGDFKALLVKRVNMIKEAIFGIFDKIKGLFTGVWGWIKSGFKGKEEGTPLPTTENTADKIEKTERERSKDSARTQKQLVNKMDEIGKKQIEEQRKVADSLKTSTMFISRNQLGGFGGAISEKQVPDEVDNWGIAFANISFGFGE